MTNNDFSTAVQDFSAGRISRRTFIQRMAALGIAAPMAAVLAGPGLAGASSASQTAVSMTRAQDGGVELTVGLTEEPDTLDPHNLTAAAAGLVGYQVMPGLVWWDYELGVSPMIAESWDTSEDGLTWTFNLRPNLTFHNGKACTAEEVVRNFEHIMDPEASFLAPDYELVESVEATDETTVVFTLKDSFAPFLAILTNRCAITDMDAYDPNMPIGTGPFKITNWQRGTGLTLEAHDGYWEEGLPAASKVNWNYYPDDDARMLAVQGGEIDIVYAVPTQQIDQIQESGDFTVDPISGLTHTYIAFNCAEGPFSDVRVRKAVAHVIDKELVVEGALWGWADIANIPFPESSPWFVETPDYEFDPEKGKALMEEAGYGDGLTLDMPISNDSYTPKIAEIIQPDLASIGIDVRIVETEWATYWPEIYLKTQYDITIMSYSARVDPDQTFYPRYHSTGVHNATKYVNDRMDELLEAGRRETDLEERKKIYEEVQLLLVDELPWLWLFIPKVAMGWQNNVSGFTQHAGNHFYVTESSKEG